MMTSSSTSLSISLSAMGNIWVWANKITTADWGARHNKAGMSAVANDWHEFNWIFFFNVYIESVLCWFRSESMPFSDLQTNRAWTVNSKIAFTTIWMLMYRYSQSTCIFASLNSDVVSLLPLSGRYRHIRWLTVCRL